MLNRFLTTLIRLFLVAFLASLTACDNSPKADKTWILANEGLFSASVSEDGKYVLLGSTTGKAFLWKLRGTKKPNHVWQHNEGDTGGIIAVALSPDHKYALTAERNSLAWWNTATGKALGYWSIPDIYSLSISADGQRALIGLRDQSFYFSLQTGTYIYALPHTGMVYANDLSKDGRFAVTASDGKEVKLWSLSTGKLKQTWLLPSKPYAVAISPNGKLVVTNAASGATTIRDSSNGKTIHTLTPDRTTLSELTFSPDSKLLATARIAQRIDLWDVKSATNTKFWRPQKSNAHRPSAATVLALEFTHKGKRLISITSNGIVQRWKVR